MGSLSTALNALATSFTRDWYQPYINPGASEEQSLRAVRWATVGFRVLMIVVASATSYLRDRSARTSASSRSRSGFSVTPTAHCWAFSSAACSRKRAARDLANPIAMICGFLFVALISNLPNDIARIFGTQLYVPPKWLPIMEFPWWICFGTIVTFAVAMLFPTGRKREEFRKRGSQELGAAVPFWFSGFQIPTPFEAGSSMRWAPKESDAAAFSPANSRRPSDVAQAFFRYG